MLGNVLLAIPDWCFSQLHFADDALAIVGGILVGIGIAGHRAGWGPRCRKCGFDLRGVTEDTPACPECGASLKTRRAVKFGVRARRWGMVSAGVLVLAAATASNVLQWPGLVSLWRERVLVEAFDLEKLIDLALGGSTRALSDLQGDLAGTGRRLSMQRALMPGQATLNALLDRMEREPSTRDTLLPLVFSPASKAYMWARESALPVRTARMLAEVAEQDPALLDKLGTQGLSSLFQGGRTAAVAQLLSSQKMISYLYRGGGAPEARVSDGPVTLALGAAFSSSSAPLWLHNLPMGLQVSDARWRVQGETDTAWREVDSVEPGGMSASANLTINSPPSIGTMEVRVRGNVVQGPDASMWRQAIGRDLRTAFSGAATAEAIAAARAVTPIEWNRTVTLKPRAEIVLTPIAPRSLGRWMDETIERTTLIAEPSGVKGKYLLLAELRGSVNATMIELLWTLEQDGHSWIAVELQNLEGATLTFDAPEFDSTKPFTVKVRPDLKRLRKQATEDGLYLDLNRALLFDSLNRMPRETRELPTTAPD